MFQGKFLRWELFGGKKKTNAATNYFKWNEKRRKTMINRTCSVISLSFRVMFLGSFHFIRMREQKVQQQHNIFEKWRKKYKLLKEKASHNTQYERQAHAEWRMTMMMMVVVQSAYHVSEKKKLVTLSHAICTHLTINAMMFSFNNWIRCCSQQLQQPS